MTHIGPGPGPNVGHSLNNFGIWYAFLNVWLKLFGLLVQVSPGQLPNLIFQYLCPGFSVEFIWILADTAKYRNVDCWSAFYRNRIILP